MKQNTEIQISHEIALDNRPVDRIYGSIYTYIGHRFNLESDVILDVIMPRCGPADTVYEKNWALLDR